MRCRLSNSIFLGRLVVSVRFFQSWYIFRSKAVRLFFVEQNQNQCCSFVVCYGSNLLLTDDVSSDLMDLNLPSNVAAWQGGNPGPSSHLPPTPDTCPPSCLGLDRGGGGRGVENKRRLGVWPIKIPSFVICHYLLVNKQF